MSSEPKKPRGPYASRREYDAIRHCGHAVRRDPEYFKESIDKKQKLIEELQARGIERELTVHEKKLLKRAGRVMGFHTQALKNIEAMGPDGRPCVKGKGQGTDHPGVGKCSFHCECKGREGGHLSYYSRKAKDKKLADLMDEIDQSNMDVLNLEPDVVLLRAKMKLFIEDRADFEPETVRSLTLISEQLRKTIETINDKKFKSMITREMFDLVMARIGDVVARHVTDPEVLERILVDWQKISVEASNKRVSKQIAWTSGETGI